MGISALSRVLLVMCCFTQCAYAQLNMAEQRMWTEITSEWQKVRADILGACIQGDFTVRDRADLDSPAKEFRVAYYLANGGQKIEMFAANSSEPDEVHIINEGNFFRLARGHDKAEESGFAFADYQPNPPGKELGSVAWPALNPMMAAVMILESQNVASDEFLESEFFVPDSIELLGGDRYRITAHPKVGIGADRGAQKMPMQVSLDVNRNRRWAIERWESSTALFSITGTNYFGEGLGGLIPDRVEVEYTAQDRKQRHKVIDFSLVSPCEMTQREFAPAHYGLTPPVIQQKSFGQRHPWLMGLVATSFLAVAYVAQSRRRR